MMEKAETERKEKLPLRFVPSRRARKNSKKMAKKIEKIERNHYGFIPSQNRWENAEKERK